jgi:hypothetical protein
MKALRAAIIFLSFLAATGAIAGQLDDYYLEQLGEKPVVAAGASLKAASQVTMRKCGMPLRKALRADWSKLESGTRKQLAKHLGKPTLSNEGIVRSNGGHFNIHYAGSGTDAPPLTDANNNSIPDWIETVANTFEAVYAREISQLGYLQPPNTPYDVYLQQLATLNEFGFTDSDVITGQTATSYIVIDNDFADAIYHPFNGAAGLKITAAHEFHHAIQFGYNFFFDLWYAEATSSWMEDEVYDSINQLYEYLVPYYTQTSLQIDAPVSISTGGGYGRWSFNRYLTETSSQANIVKSFWEKLATKTPVNGADIPMLPVINEVLASNAGSLPTSFLGFSKRFLLNNWASHQNETGLYPALTFNAGNTFTVNTTFTVPAASLPDYSFKYLKLAPSSAAPGPLSISYPNKPAAYVIIAFLQTAGTSTQFVADTNGNITIPAVSSADTLYLLISNNVSGAANTPAEPAQPIQPPTDATNPNTGNAIVIQVPTAAPPASSGGGGGGGGCFIATAAYGSYLHPKVMVLREFRDRWLLTNTPGRLIVAAYYRLSPPLAAIISGNETLRLMARFALTPLIFAIEHFWLFLALFAGGTAYAMRTAGRRRLGRQIIGHCPSSR